MLQVKNDTPFAAQISVLPDLAGIDTVYVVVKATFELGLGRPRVAEQQIPMVPADVHWGEPSRSSIRYAGETHLQKPATDIVMVGDGFAPGGRPVPYFGVSLMVGRLRKLVQVYGDRVWTEGVLGLQASSPVPTARVPLTYERAFGGRHDLDDGRFVAETRNPIGTGFRGKRRDREMHGIRLPNLEDPRHPIKSASDRPPPACFGHVAPSWQPRSSFAGTYDEAWQVKRAPYFPEDLDPRFFQTAPPDQVYVGHLGGGEPVQIANASPRGFEQFALPVC